MRNREARGEGRSKSGERSMLDQARPGSHIPRAAVSAVTKAFRDPASNWSVTPRADQSARALHARRGPFFWRAQPRRRQRGVAAADRAWPPSWIFERKNKKKRPFSPGSPWFLDARALSRSPGMECSAPHSLLAGDSGAFDSE